MKVAIQGEMGSNSHMATVAMLGNLSGLEIIACTVSAEVMAKVVSGAVDGAVLEAGRVHLAPGGAAHLEVAGRTTWRCRLTAGDTVSGHRPSVDRLFHAVAAAAGGDGVGVLLTGMGRDGAAGLLAMKEAGAVTIGQDEASAIVYGMPRAAFELGAVQRQLPLTKIGGTLMALCRAPALMET